MNKENCALNLVDEIILYCDARSKKISNFTIRYVMLRDVTLRYVKYLSAHIKVHIAFIFRMKLSGSRTFDPESDGLTLYRNRNF